MIFGHGEPCRRDKFPFYFRRGIGAASALQPMLEKKYLREFQHPHSDKYALCNCEAILSIVIAVY